MINCCFFIHMNVKEFKPKIHLIKFYISILFRTFENEHLLNQKESILQRIIKTIHVINLTFW